MLKLTWLANFNRAPYGSCKHRQMKAEAMTALLQVMTPEYLLQHQDNIMFDLGNEDEEMDIADLLEAFIGSETHAKSGKFVRA